MQYHQKKYLNCNFMKRLTVLLIIICATINMYAQNVTTSGTILSKQDGLPLPGVTVLQKGTSNGTITDLDGRYSLSVTENSVITVSYVGFKTYEYTATASTNNVNINLEEDNVQIGDVVVIGYGTQKRSVVTAAIAGINADEINSSSVRVDNALKGMASGVTVTQASGQPGDGSQIRIRGVGTINNSDPLYVIDGMPVDKGGIDYLNPSDIQSIEVLKDAASGAVYGARAANGVILVTTKKGKIGKCKVAYDFSYSLQNPWQQRFMLNATEYATLMNEGSLNAGLGLMYDDPASFGTGTDWQDEVFNDNAPIVNHQLSVSGASDRVNYYFSAGYYDQEGIVGGDYDRSNYNRISLRSNTIYTLIDTKERNFLHKMTAGINVSYSHIKSKNITTNSATGSVLGSALYLSPLLTVYATDEQAVLDAYAGNSAFTPVRNSDGRLYSIPGSTYNEMTNPLASLSLPAAEYWTDKIVSNLYAEINLWDNIKFRSSLGLDGAFWGNDGYNKKYYLNSTQNLDHSSVYSSMEKSLTWQLENTLSYEKVFGNHSVSLLLGQSALSYSSRYLSGSNNYMLNEDADRISIDFTTGLRDNGDMAVSGGLRNPHTLASIFARASYDYKGKYMAQATVRRDGSSNFGPDKHYATFPSFSLGWNITEESFLDNRPTWWTSTKIRGSWGKNGNESIGQFRYIPLTATGANYIFGSEETTAIGIKPASLANTYICWEESEQTDIGIDFGFFKSALTFTADYYKKRTSGMLMNMPIPTYAGENAPVGNVGTMTNKGWEFDALYRFKVAGINFSVSGNATYLKNELIDLGNESGYSNLDYIQGFGTVTRAQNGNPFPFFYGYKTAGIFQNQEQINNCTLLASDGTAYSKTAKPGDVIFVDTNNDGTINDKDQTMIGKGMPDWIFGFNFSADYKGFDFSMMMQGTIGNDIYDASRRTDIYYANLPEYMLDRWTGEGTSNTYPRFVLGDTKNWVSSDLMVKDGSYLRLKTIELGYTLPDKITKRVFISRLRFYVSAQNLLTFTKYEGFDPEISSGGTSLGLDMGNYPQAKVYTFGLSCNF